MRVLLAEDDGELRFIIAYMLTKEGYRVEEAADGTALARRLSALATQPVDERDVHVLVADICMPGGTAFEAIENLEGRLSGLSIIFMTSDPAPDIVKHAEDLGVRNVLPKPIDMARLTQLIRETV